MCFTQETTAKGLTQSQVEKAKAVWIQCRVCPVVSGSSCSSLPVLSNSATSLPVIRTCTTCPWMPAMVTLQAIVQTHVHSQDTCIAHNQSNTRPIARRQRVEEPTCAANGSERTKTRRQHRSVLFTTNRKLLLARLPLLSTTSRRPCSHSQMLHASLQRASGYCQDRQICHRVCWLSIFVHIAAGQAHSLPVRHIHTR